MKITKDDVSELFKMVMEAAHPDAKVIAGDDVIDLFWTLSKDPAKDYRLWKNSEGNPVDDETEFDFSAGFVSGVKMFMLMQAMGKVSIKAIDVTGMDLSDVEGV